MASGHGVRIITTSEGYHKIELQGSLRAQEAMAQELTLRTTINALDKALDSLPVNLSVAPIEVINLA